MLKHPRPKDGGFSLIELMVGILVGMVVVGGVIATYVTAIRGSTYTLRTAKVNEELRAVLDVMANDIRRAGHTDAVTLTTNPFAVRDSVTPANQTDISIYDRDGNGVGECIVLSYDATYKSGNTPSAVDANDDFFGYRQNADQIQMLKGTKSNTGDCSGTNNWEAVTNNDTVIIDSLSFSTGQTDGGNFVGSRCLNVTVTPRVNWASKAGSIKAACEDTAASGYVAPAATDVLLESRKILITIVGHHKDDAATKITLTEAVKVMNDRKVN